MQEKENSIKTLFGVVESISGLKTAKVSVSAVKKTFVGKSISRTKVFFCHIPEGLELSPGQTVLICESKPLSKTKNHVVKKIV